MKTEATFDQIDCFVSLSKTLSFTESAIHLGLTQPSVSRQIRNLEAILGVQLFIRNKHHVQLTAQGREFLADVEPVIKAFRSTIQKTAEKTRELSGPISIGCLPEVGQNYFHKRFLEFQKMNPQIDLHVNYLLTHEILALLRSGKLDFGITTQLQISENFRSYKLMEERAIMVTRTANKLSLKGEKVTNLPFIGYSNVDGLLNAFLKTYFAPADVSKITKLSSVNSHASMIESLLARDCFAVLPSFSVEKLIESKKLKQATDKELRTPMYLIETEKIAVSAKEKAFRSFLVRVQEGA